VWRRVLQANLRYYEALGRLSVDYVRAVTGAVASLGAGLPASAAAATRPAPAVPSPPAGTSAPALVLEAETGKSAEGAFIVENLLSEGMSSPVVASAFASPEGHELRPRLAFEPEVVVLDAGEQVLVRVVATIDEALETGVDYRGEVTVPGLVSRGLSIVVRRLASNEAPARPTPTPRRRSSASPRRKADDGPRRAR
jgi:hypothetical protein